ncbi:MAG: hypothetical protein M3Y13_01355 [Armatimonadota bacterium]|nr:hypothetical protein [Armatimonadota bacterium]
MADTTVPAAAPAPAAPDVKPVQTPLTLIMTLKSKQAFADLNATLQKYNALPASQNPIMQAMDAVGTVHFARFVFLDNNTKLAVITTFDHDLETYLEDFCAKIGPVFDILDQHMVDGPPAPVQQHPQEFLAYVQKHNVPTVGFYSAYPTKTVLDIRNAD